MVLDTLTASSDDVEKMRQKYINLRNQGELDRRLTKLIRKQKRATTTNGPHPHYGD